MSADGRFAPHFCRSITKRAFPKVDDFVYPRVNTRLERPKRMVGLGAAQRTWIKCLFGAHIVDAPAKLGRAAILGDSFAITLHHETRDMEAYVEALASDLSSQGQAGALDGMIGNVALECYLRRDVAAPFGPPHGRQFGNLGGLGLPERPL